MGEAALAFKAAWEPYTILPAFASEQVGKQELRVRLSIS
jgi:hypothetical protein